VVSWLLSDGRALTGQTEDNMEKSAWLSDIGEATR
jgi:hypothetical protein